MLNSNLRKIIALILALLLSLSLFACKTENTQESTEPSTTTAPLQKVAVLYLELDESQKSAYDGFFKALSDNGYLVDNNYSLSDMQCLDKDYLTATAEKIVSESPDVIFAIGVDAALAAKKATKDIPIVFACVDDPIASGLVESCEKPEANVTGICDYSPVFEQIELLCELYPDVERIGCVYNGADEDSIFSANLASGEAQLKDVKFTMYPSLTEGEFEFNVEDKALEKCDALYLTDDALVKSCLEDTLALAKEKKIPVIAESSELVEKGCLATCITDYEKMGYSAGELCVILLRSLKSVSDIPVEYAIDCTVVINSATQKSLKLELPEEIKSSAVFVKTK